MSTIPDSSPLEAQIGQWRAYLRRRRAIGGPDVEELETHLRDQVGVLTEAGLADDEAFLVAVKRMGSLDAISREFAREHSERLWKQLVIASEDEIVPPSVARTEAILVFVLAVAAAVAIKIPALFGIKFGPDPSDAFYARNMSLFVLPVLTAYFVWKRRMDVRRAAWLAIPFLVAAVVQNIFPFGARSHTLVLSALHLPIALWLVAGVAYVGGRWFAGSARMDFVRFSGELAVYYVLIAIGGGVLTGYFVWKRRWAIVSGLWLAPPFAAAAVFANIYPFRAGSNTEVLTAVHLPIALWLAVGLAYVRGRWFAGSGRMDFVRFSGELVIYYVLIALGGGVLTGFTMMMFAAIGIKAAWLAQGWIIPCGAMGAVIIGSWLVEAKQSVIENMAPVLTRLFTPLFTILLLVFLATRAWTGSPINVKRDVLIGFDLLLVLVVGLVLYAASARDPQAPPDFFDGLQLLLVVSALAVDAVTLAAIAARISEFGFTPNRVAALGENLILLVNLAWTAWLYARFVRHRGSFAALERWQIAYLPVYSVWAALVVVTFPPVFGYR